MVDTVLDCPVECGQEIEQASGYADELPAIDARCEVGRESLDLRIASGMTIVFDAYMNVRDVEDSHLS